jgi:protein-S-isoprenylcysteine O-methyltransferase Ste14
MADSRRDALPVRSWLAAALYLGIGPFLPLLITRNWLWWEGWLYAGVLSVAFVLNRLPSKSAATKASDQSISPLWDRGLIQVVGTSIIPLSVGISHVVGSGSSLALGMRLLGLTGLLSGVALGTWALWVNPRFSGVTPTTATILIDSGPYALVRHPGYAGAIAAYISTPLLLNSAIALIPAVLLAALAMIRTAAEDSQLLAETPTYEGYSLRVRYRLLPYLW